MKELRPYQDKVLKEIFHEYENGKKSVCACLPTGSGKTTIAVESALTHLKIQRGASIVWLAPLKELINQSKSYFPNNVHVTTTDEDTEPQETMFPRIHISTVQSLSHAGRRFRPRGTLLVLDEAQYFWGTEEWSSVFKHYLNNGCKILSLSATPARVNGDPLRTLSDSLIVGPSISELTDNKYLVPLQTFAPEKNIVKDLNPVEIYKKYALGTKAAVFCYSNDDALNLSDEFNKNGIRSGHALDRNQIEKHRNGEIEVLCNVYMLSVGYDDPSIETIILNRRCGNPSTMIQMVGRAIRPSKGKKVSNFFDLYGVIHNDGFGLPNDDRIYSLDDKPKLVRNEDLVPNEDFIVL